MCLLVCIGWKADATRDALFKGMAESLIEAVIIWHFICQIEMEWKPHPMCPVIEWEQRVCPGNSSESQNTNLSGHQKRQNY